MSSRASAAALLHTTKSWEDFRDRLRQLDKKQRGDAFESLVKYFLRLDPKYATSLRHVWRLEEVPPSVRRYLNLPRPDEGIDLVVETTTGEYWAVQCKYREDTTRSLKRSELATFTDLAFGICKNMTLALVCTTANRFSHKLKLYKERIEFCSSDVWQALDREFFDRVRAVLTNQQPRIEPANPRPHQRLCVESAYEYFVTDANTRGKLIMPCGTGKSLTAFWIAAELGAKAIVIAVPSLALVRQTLESWTRESMAAGRKINWIAVCSDDSVEDVDLTLLTPDLGIRVHTDPREIARWLEREKDGLSVVFTTYQSGATVADAARRAGVTFDLGIMDEAHKTVGKRDSLFGHLLHDNNVRIRQRLFMTATERRYRGESDQVVSMDDIQLYGGTVEHLSFKQALATRPPILSDYKVVTVAVLREEVANLIKRNALVQPDEGGWRHVEAGMLAAAIALRKAMDNYPIRHAISFHSSVARAKVFKDCQDSVSATIPTFGPLLTYHVSGLVPAGLRSEMMREFAESERALVTNARCLTEGVDVPNVDCVLFADPKNSAVDIVQAVGRALRPTDKKEFAYVVVPVLIDTDEFDQEAVNSAFGPVLLVLRALAANDERIIEYFRTISEGLRRPAHGIISIDVPIGVRVDAQAFVDAIEARCWSRLAKLSWRPFEAARAFVHSLELSNYADWKKHRSEEKSFPRDIPAAPDQIYRGSGWISWGDWLGTGAVASQERKFRPFASAREFVRSLRLKSVREWEMYYKGAMPALPAHPDDIPTLPSANYRGAGWTNWGDWLGTGYVANRSRSYLPFSKARALVRTLGLRNEGEWRRHRDQLPDGVPKKPEVVYKAKGWKSWGDWLGTGRIANQNRKSGFLSYTEARKFVHGLKLNGYDDWQLYRIGKYPGKGKRPLSIPSDPYGYYKDKGWVSWPDWCGTNNRSRAE